MKKTAIIVAVALVSSLSALQVNAQKKMGYVNMQEVIMNMPEAAKADTALQKYQQNLYGEIQNMRTEFQKNAQAFVTDSLSMSEAVKEVKRDELESQQERVGRFQQSAQQKVSQRQQSIFKPIIEKAQNAVNVVAKEKGYTWVFNDTGDGSILLTKPEGDDLTAAVKVKLDIK